jgi:hypothetical protein
MNSPRVDCIESLSAQPQQVSRPIAAQMRYLSQSVLTV